jgi:hypothetical protein
LCPENSDPYTGHVIDDLLKLIKSRAEKINTIRWYDGFLLAGAESFPVHNPKELVMRSMTKMNLDIGFIAIEGLDLLNLFRNKKLVPLRPVDMEGISIVNPIAFYLVGYPEEFIRISDWGNYRTVKPLLKCLPIIKIDRDETSNIDFWQDPSAFYGKIIETNNEPQSIVGMSGGPIFIVGYTADQKISHKFIGVQSAWLKSERIIKVEAYDKIMNKLSEYIANIDEQALPT